MGYYLCFAFNVAVLTWNVAQLWYLRHPLYLLLSVISAHAVRMTLPIVRKKLRGDF